MAAHQQLTHKWWNSRKSQFDLFILELVLREAGSGDFEASSRRLSYLEGIPSIIMKEQAYTLAEQLVINGAISRVAFADALHISVATVHGMEFLLTWNCKHIANAEIKSRIENTCRSLGFEPPILCTPEELMGGE